MIRYELTLALLLVAVAETVAASARAEPTTIEKSTADALFRDGKALMEKKQFDAGCPKLAESHRLQPGGGVALALAICHEGQGKLASAWSDYREALALAIRDKRKDREDAARTKIAELEPRISRLTVRATSREGLSVTLDGVALSAASFGTAIPIDGGAHVIEASAPGRVSRKTELTIAAEKDRKEVEIGPLDPEPTARSKVVTPIAPVAPPDEKHGSVVPYVIGGVGIVALGVGGYFGVTAIGKRKDVSAACPGDVCTDPAMIDRNGEAKRSAMISNIAIGIGIVAIGTAIVLIVVDHGERHGESKPRVAAGVGPGSVAMEITW